MSQLPRLPGDSSELCATDLEGPGGLSASCPWLGPLTAAPGLVPSLPPRSSCASWAHLLRDLPGTQIHVSGSACGGPTPRHHVYGFDPIEARLPRDTGPWWSV